MSSQGQTRRQFLKDGAAAAALSGLALGGIPSASAQTAAGFEGKGSGSGFYDPSFTDKFWPENSEHPEGRWTPLADLVGMITPSHLHFSANHGNPTPNIDAQQHRLLIHGMVDRPMMFTMDDLKRLPSVSRFHYVACAGNGGGIIYASRHDATTVQETHGLTACSEWTGVLLSTLFNMVGVEKGANWMVAEGADVKKHAMTSPVAKAWDDAILVYGQNGQPINPEQGYPLRLLVPGFEGTRNVKWLRRIKLTDQPTFSGMESSTYVNLKKDGIGRNFQFEMEPGGVITFPSGAQQLHGTGFYEISGLAWSGGGAVHRVEISVDGGRTWKDAQLQAPVLKKAHTRYRLPWNWDGQEAVLMSRTTDDTGDIQPSLAEFTKIWHVTPDYWKTTTNVVQHFNAIQPWRIDRDGKVTNGMWHPSNNV
jgi:sulfane dehydrogenase subunit SoxC